MTVAITIELGRPELVIIARALGLTRAPTEAEARRFLLSLIVDRLV